MKDGRILFGVCVIITMNIFSLQRIYICTEESVFGGTMCEDEKWIDNEYEWSDFFGVNIVEWEDSETGEYFEKAVDPINDTYEIKEKPNEHE